MSPDPPDSAPDDGGLGAPPPSIERVFGDQVSTAQRYAELLATTGVEHGLIGPREVSRLWDRHLLNCGVVATVPVQSARVADVGSGAGLPGLVWAIARPDLDVHLVEPLLRRTRWLTSTIEELALENVTVHRARAEAIAGDLVVDVVTARAVARLDELARWCLPLLGAGGEMLALKGRAAADELAEADAMLRRAGVVDAAVEELGSGLVDPPTRVVRVRLGSHGPTRLGGSISGQRATRPRARRSSGGRGRRRR